MGELDGRVAIVTGAGNPRGMGRAIALHLASQGARIVVSDVAAASPDELQQALGYSYGAALGLEGTVQEVKERGSEAVAVEGDVTDPVDVERVVQAAVETFGRIDILVNVAGGAWGSALISDYDPDLWMKTLKVNLFGAFLTTKFALPHLAGSGHGAIVNISSVAAIRPGEYTSAYDASKAGLVALTRSVAVEWGPQGVRANALLPGDIQTDLLSFEYRAVGMLMGTGEEDVAKRSAEATPVRRLGGTADVAELVGFLCSDRAAYLTGLAIPVTGGRELVCPT